MYRTESDRSVDSGLYPGDDVLVRSYDQMVPGVVLSVSTGCVRVLVGKAILPCMPKEVYHYGS